MEETKSKYYAVKIGRVKGVYRSFEDCKKQIVNYPNARFRTFDKITDALEYLEWTDEDKIDYLQSGHRQSASQKKEKEKLDKAIKKIIKK